MFVRTDVPLPEGCPVRLRLVLPGALGTVLTTAHVAWAIQPQGAEGLAAGMGLHVTPPEGSAGRSLERLARDWDAHCAATGSKTQVA